MFPHSTAPLLELALVLELVELALVLLELALVLVLVEVALVLLDVVVLVELPPVPAPELDVVPVDPFELVPVLAPPGPALLAWPPLDAALLALLGPGPAAGAAPLHPAGTAAAAGGELDVAGATAADEEGPDPQARQNIPHARILPRGLAGAEAPSLPAGGGGLRVGPERRHVRELVRPLRAAGSAASSAAP